jgi:hypothetical protein
MTGPSPSTISRELTPSSSPPGTTRVPLCNASWQQQASRRKLSSADESSARLQAAPDPDGESVGNFDVSSDAGKRVEASNSNSDERYVSPKHTGS